MLKYNGIKNTILILIILVLAVYIYFVKTGIDGYGAKSSDYWGYQQGMKEIISKSSELQNSYDEIFISGYFNNADSVITFYNFDHQCTKCKLGFVDKMYDPLKNQLFIIRSAEMDVVLKLMKGHTVKQVDTIQIASGVKEFVLFTVSN